MLQRHVQTHHVCLHSPSSMRGSFSVRRRNTAALVFVSPVGTPGPQQSTLTDAHSVWQKIVALSFARLENPNYSGLNCRDKRSCFEAGLPRQVTAAGPACKCKASHTQYSRLSLTFSSGFSTTCNYSVTVHSACCRRSC